MMPPPSGQPSFMDLGQLEAQRDQLQSQLTGARAMGLPSGRRYNTVGGALAGGVGDMLGGMAGRSKEAQYANALMENARQRQALGGPQQPSPMMAPPTGMTPPARY